MQLDRPSRANRRRLLVRGLIASALLAFTGWNATRSDALAEAEDSYRRSDFPAALGRSLDHLDRRPWSRDAARLVARCFSRLDDPDAAQPYYERSGPLDVKDANVRAYAIVRANRREEAIRAYRAILERWPDDTTALSRLGAIYLSQSRWNDARGPARRLAASKDGALAGQVMLASIEHQAGNPESAVMAAEKVLELDPDLRSEWVARPSFLVQLGEDLIRLGRPPEARRHLLEALKDRDDPNTWLLLGQAYRKEGASDDAERSWRRAVEIEPRLAAGWLELGRLALERNRPADAIDPLLRATELAPDASAPLFSLSAAYRRLGKTTEARQAQDRLDALRRRSGIPATGMVGKEVPATP